MKLVSFEIAKAIKEVGFPQMYIKNHCYYYNEKLVIPDNIIEDFKVVDCIAAPTYLEVWLWLWRSKRMAIDAECMEKLDTNVAPNMWENGILSARYNDPEEAIIAAITYMVDKNLIK